MQQNESAQWEQDRVADQYDCATDETKVCYYNPVPVDGEYLPEKYKFNETILLLLIRVIYHII